MADQFTENTDRRPWQEFLDVLDQLVLSDDEVRDEHMKELLRTLDVQTMEKLLSCSVPGEVPKQLHEFFTDDMEGSELSINNFTDLQWAMIYFVGKNKSIPEEVIDFEPHEEVRHQTHAVLTSEQAWGESYEFFTQIHGHTSERNPKKNSEVLN